MPSIDAFSVTFKVCYETEGQCNVDSESDLYVGRACHTEHARSQADVNDGGQFTVVHGSPPNVSTQDARARCSRSPFQSSRIDVFVCSRKEFEQLQVTARSVIR